MVNETEPPTLLVTARLFLCRPDAERHTAPAFAVIDAERQRLSRWLPWVSRIQSLADERHFMERSCTLWDRREELHWVVLDRQTGAFVGSCGLHHIDWSVGLAELGYWISQGFEGSGRMREAVQAVQDAAFGLGLRRLEVRCSANNERSAAIPERLGYHLDGVLRQNVWLGGSFVDTRVYSLLDGEQGEGSGQIIDPADPVVDRARR